MVKNSLKYTHEGSIHIIASYSRLKQRLTVKICDTGIGIAPEDQHKLFKAFGKVKSADNSLNKEGVGLGLTICQAIINQNGGHIQAHSEGLDKGATFKFYFKLEEVQEEQREAPSEIGIIEEIKEAREEEKAVDVIEVELR